MHLQTHLRFRSLYSKKVLRHAVHTNEARWLFDPARVGAPLYETLVEQAGLHGIVVRQPAAGRVQDECGYSVEDEAPAPAARCVLPVAMRRPPQLPTGPG